MSESAALCKSIWKICFSKFNLSAWCGDFLYLDYLNKKRIDRRLARWIIFDMDVPSIPTSLKLDIYFNEYGYIYETPQGKIPQCQK